jgi:hypothetical protein
MKRVKRTGQRNPWRLISDPEKALLTRCEYNGPGIVQPCTGHHPVCVEMHTRLTALLREVWDDAQRRAIAVPRREVRHERDEEWVRAVKEVLTAQFPSEYNVLRDEILRRMGIKEEEQLGALRGGDDANQGR